MCMCTSVCDSVSERERMNMRMKILLPFIGMVMAIMAQTGGVVVNKAAMSTGTNAYINIVYANAVAALILLPSALIIFHRLIVYNPSFFCSYKLFDQISWYIILLYFCSVSLSKVLTVLLFRANPKSEELCMC